MKLNKSQADAYFRKPTPDATGLLIYGADPTRVSPKRKHVIKNLIGENGEQELRLTRFTSAELRADPSLLRDAIKTISFFPGPRVVLVEEAIDSVFSAIEAAVAAWEPNDAQIIVTAGQLKATSRLRKLFEGHKNARAIALYDDAPSLAELQSMLATAELRNVDRDAMSALAQFSGDLGPGDFQQLLTKIATYKIGDDRSLSITDVAACAPSSIDATLEDAVNAVAEARHQDIDSILRRLEAQGTTGVALCIGIMRHFRTLYAAAADPKGAATGITRVRPPVFGPRRNRMLRQCQNWGVYKLERAIAQITEVNLQLRSPNQNAPEMALVERLLIRLSMLAKRQ
ncbi:MAG: DNA polymerase III subunit delta [Aestuariivita sp.]|nr:DNA polymerase III subunit delta [Aestuariivita sp.]MCY4202992.1 DNA polymerase III subunit delta [Aestuariivita sp.]